MSRGETGRSLVASLVASLAPVATSATVPRSSFKHAAKTYTRDSSVTTLSPTGAPVMRQSRLRTDTSRRYRMLQLSNGLWSYLLHS